MELKHPYFNQFVRQLGAIFYQSQMSELITLQLTSSCLENVLFETGIGPGVDSVPFDTAGDYLTDMWWKHLLVFLHSKSVKLHTLVRLPLPATKNDDYLMLRFIHYGFRKKDLKILNNCRMFLGVILV